MVRFHGIQMHYVFVMQERCQEVRGGGGNYFVLKCAVYIFVNGMDDIQLSVQIPEIACQKHIKFKEAPGTEKR